MIVLQTNTIIFERSAFMSTSVMQVRVDDDLRAKAAAVYEELGIDINGDHDKLFGSSDIGNVSFACPAFHPTLQIVDRGVAIHTREFADAVKTQRAHDAIKLGAEVISLHITKTFMDEDKIKAMKEDFNK